MATRRPVRPSATVLLALLTWLAAATLAAAQSTKTIVDCQSKLVKVRNLTSSPIDALIHVVLAEYKDPDPDCEPSEALVPSVQTNRSLVAAIQPGAQNTRTLTFSDLGFVLPSSCDVYILTARTSLSSSPGDTSEASCASSAASSALQIVALADVQTQVASDLVPASKIDLTAIRPTGGDPSCLGPREYAMQVTNLSADRHYQVTVDSKYICTRTAASPTYCTSDEGSFLIPGNGIDHVRATDFDVTPSECSAPVTYLNVFDGPALPSCCDDMRVAVQCTDFVVTGRFTTGAVQGILPAFSTQIRSVDYEINPPTYSCEAFLPPLETPGPPASCFGDADADAVLGGPPGSGTCDNCPETYNPGQQDADADGHGDVCDNCASVYNPGQGNNDGDGLGDDCDTDDDNDGVLDTVDNCPLNYNPSQQNTDQDPLGDACDSDDDNDGVLDVLDNCPLVYNPAQGDFDGDGLGDACDGPTCQRCPSFDDCSELGVGAPCGAPACGGVCRLGCGGGIGCYKPW